MKVNRQVSFVISRSIFIAALLLAFKGPCFADSLILTVADARTGHAMPSRVRIRDSAGKDVVPPGAVEVSIGPDRWFVSSGKVRLEVTPGHFGIRVERGLEFVPYVGAVEVRGTTTLRVVLRQWVNMRARGYVSGENHLHIDTSRLPAILAAEDLDYGSSLYWWNGPKLSLPAGTAPFRVLEFAGYRIPTSAFDAEVEQEWGSVYLTGLRRQISLAPDPATPNLPFVREAHSEGALVSYQAGWSREVLFDALLGYVNVVNVANNNFLRHRYQQRPQYSNLLGVDGLPEYPITDDGMMRMNTDTYYRLLNCGLRLAAGAETAAGFKSNPAGYNRAYVRIPPGADLAEFLDGWRRGRNFVTNGPMLFLRAADGNQPGDVIKLPDSGGTVQVEISAFSDQPLRSVEIVVNGRVVGSAHVSRDAKTAKLRTSIKITQGAWIAARATAEDRLLPDEDLRPYQEASELGPSLPSRLRFAHTSPIYVTVGGKRAYVPESVDEARRILAAFERFAEATADPAHFAEIEHEMPLALENLERLGEVNYEMKEPLNK